MSTDVVRRKVQLQAVAGMGAVPRHDSSVVAVEEMREIKLPVRAIINEMSFLEHS